MPTATGDTIQLTTSRNISAAPLAYIVKRPTPRTNKTMIMISLRLYLIPEPPKASKRAKIVATMTIIVAHIVMMSCPHSKYIGLYLLLQSKK